MNRSFREDPKAAKLRREVGQRIKYVRKMKGLSQEALGAKIKPPRGKQSISKWEKGETGASVGQLKEIARALNCRVDYLVSGQGSPNVMGTLLLSVAGLEKRPVPRANFQRTPESDDNVAYIHSDVTDADWFIDIPADDDSMQPEIRPSDRWVYREGVRPAPGDYVAALDKQDGVYLYRQYRQVRDRNRPGVTFELAALNRNWGTVEGGSHIEIIGVFTELVRRKIKAL